MDEKDLKKGNGEQPSYDESIRPFLEDKEPHRKKSASKSFVFGIILIVIGGLLGLCYLGSACFVSSSSYATTEVTAVEWVHAPVENYVPVAVAVDEAYAVSTQVVETKDYAVVYSDSEYKESTVGGKRTILFGDVSEIYVTAIDADTDIKITGRDENKLVISGDKPNNVRFSLEGGILKITQQVKDSSTKISIDLSYVSGISVNSASGDISASGDNTTLDFMAFSTSSGDAKVKYIDTLIGSFKSHSGDLDINRCNIDTFNFNTSSGDFSVNDCEASNFITSASSGDVEAAALRCSGSIEIRTTSGDVSLSDIYAQTLTTNSSSGYLKLKDSNIMSLSASSSSGNKNITNSYCHEIKSTSSSGNFVADNITLQSLNLNASSGRAGIKLIPEENININIATSSGNVELQFVNDIAVDLKCDKITKNDLTLDNTSKNKVNIQTNSGTVRLTN